MSRRSDRFENKAATGGRGLCAALEKRRHISDAAPTPRPTAAALWVWRCQVRGEKGQYFVFVFFGVARQEVDVGGAGEDYELFGVAGHVVQALGLGERGMAICVAGDEQDWAADVGDVVDRTEVGGGDAATELQPSKQHGGQSVAERTQSHGDTVMNGF
jgi:hypothetical protein